MEENNDSGNFVKTLFFVFFSCSTEASLDMGPQMQQISKKIKRQKWEKTSSKNKKDTNKSIKFSLKILFGLVFTIIWQKKKHEL